MFEIKNYKAYIESSKPKVVMLMIFTSFIGMLLANPLELNLEILILGKYWHSINVFISWLYKSAFRSEN